MFVTFAFASKFPQLVNDAKNQNGANLSPPPPHTDTHLIATEVRAWVCNLR